MPVDAPRVAEGSPNAFFDFTVQAHVSESIPMVVGGRSGKVRDRQREMERKLLREVFHGLNFQRRSCDLKSRNFPR